MDVARVVAVAPCFTDFVIFTMDGQFFMLILSNLTSALNSFSLCGEVAGTSLSTILFELPFVGLMILYYV